MDIDLQVHTIASKFASGDVCSIMKYASHKGLKGVVISDVGPFFNNNKESFHIGNLRIIPKNEFDARLIHGVNANILNIKGKVDATLYKEIEFISASLFIDKSLNNHDGSSNYKFELKSGDSAGVTQALINTINSGKIKCLANIDNSDYQFDLDKVVKVAVDKNVGFIFSDYYIAKHLEKYGNLDFYYKLAAKCVEYGAYVGVASGSVHVKYVGVWDVSLKIVEDAGVKRLNLLNNISVFNEFIGRDIFNDNYNSSTF